MLRRLACHQNLLLLSCQYNNTWNEPTAGSSSPGCLSVQVRSFVHCFHIYIQVIVIVIGRQGHNNSPGLILREKRDRGTVHTYIVFKDIRLFPPPPSCIYVLYISFTSLLLLFSDSSMPARPAQISQRGPTNASAAARRIRQEGYCYRHRPSAISHQPFIHLLCVSGHAQSCAAGSTSTSHAIDWHRHRQSPRCCCCYTGLQERYIYIKGLLLPSRVSR